MTQLLVSVRSRDEARRAIEGGADLIDIKDPGRGSLGPATSAVWREVVSEVRGQRPVSAALGELLTDQPERTAGETGSFAYVKLGLAGCRGMADWAVKWGLVMDGIPQSVSRVAVGYADAPRVNAPDPMDVVRIGAELGCEVLLVDTADKSGGRLLELLSPKDLQRLMTTARAAGMRVALAGSLDLSSIVRVLGMGPDWIAVRGAACSGGRQGVVCASRVRAIAELLYATPVDSN